MVHGTITECVTDAVIKDTLLLTARIGGLNREDAIIAISKATLPEIARGDRWEDRGLNLKE